MSHLMRKSGKYYSFSPFSITFRHFSRQRATVTKKLHSVINTLTRLSLKEPEMKRSGAGRED